MRMRVLGTAAAVTLSSLVSPVQAATFTSFLVNWTGSATTPDLIRISVSSPDAVAFTDNAFDISTFSVTVNGNLTVKAGMGGSFTSADIVDFSLSVTSSSPAFAPYTIDLTPVGLPSPVPLATGLPLLLAGLAAPGPTARRRSRAA